MIGNCPNCGSYFHCDCTWDERQRATEIRRRQAREARRKIGKPTVVEREIEECRKAEKARPTR
jgi:hypothetical protein